MSHKCVGTLPNLKKFGPRVTENFGHLYHDQKITAVVRDLRLSLFRVEFWAVRCEAKRQVQVTLHVELKLLPSSWTAQETNPPPPKSAAHIAVLVFCCHLGVDEVLAVSFGSNSF